VRSGESGKVREAIEQSVWRIVVEGNGPLVIKTKPDRLLGRDGNVVCNECRGQQNLPDGGIPLQSVRRWKLIPTTELYSIQATMAADGSGKRGGNFGCKLSADNRTD
jgi:hypothetical protein